MKPNNEAVLRDALIDAVECMKTLDTIRHIDSKFPALDKAIAALAMTAEDSEPSGEPVALPVFTRGSVYQSNTYGPLTFVGMDTFHGQTTYQFKEGMRSNRYILPDAMEREFLTRPATKQASPAMDSAADARDAARYRWLRDEQCNALHLTRDGDHACNYVTAKEWIEGYCPEDFAHDDPAEVQAMKDANTIWHLQIYPHTPIGFNDWHGATLDAAIDAAMGDAGKPS